MDTAIMMSLPFFMTNPIKEQMWHGSVVVVQLLSPLIQIIDYTTHIMRHL